MINTKIENQIARLSAALFVSTNPEQVKAITTRGGKQTRDPAYPDGAARQRKSVPVPAPVPVPVMPEEEVEREVEDITPQAQPVQQDPDMRQDFRDTNFIPFPRRQRRHNPQMEDQFSKFVEVIQKLYISVPLLDALQVPMYAKYIRDILNKKRPLPATEVIKLTEECSEAILDSSLKRSDPGSPTINCSIGEQYFDNALCDLGASVSVMPKSVFDKLKYMILEPTSMCLQLADKSIRYPIGIAENIPVKIREYFVPVDFVVLEMPPDSKVSLILGRPFLSTANAHIDVGKGQIKFIINGKEETFEFKPRPDPMANVIEQEEDQSSSPALETFAED